MELLCKWIRCLVWYSCVHYHPFIMICVCVRTCVCVSMQDRIALMNRYIYEHGSSCVCVCVCLFFCIFYKSHQSREFHLSCSPPSLGGEGISGAGEVKGEAKLSARLGRQASQCTGSNPPRALSHSHQLVFPFLGCMDDVIQDGPMDHLSISRVPFSSIKSSSRVWVGRGVWRG